MGIGQHTVEQRRRPGLFHPEPDHLRRGVKGRDQVRGEKEYGQADQLRQKGRHQDPETGPLPDPVILSGSEILSHEGGQRHHKADDRKESESLDLCIGAVARHHHLPKGIDMGLDNDVGKGNDGILRAGRKSEPDDLPEDLPVKPDLPYAQAVALLRLPQQEKTQHGAGRLGDHRGDRRTAHAHVEDSDKQKIQHQIEERRKDQVVERVTAVPDRLQDPHKNIVHHQAKGSGKIDLQIGDCLLHHALRRIHPAQDLRGEQGPEQSHHQAERQAERHHRMDRPVQVSPVPRPEKGSCHHTGSGRNAVQKADHHKGQAS